MSGWVYDYSRASIAELTAALEFSLFGVVAKGGEFGDLLARYHEIWADAVALHADPVTELMREADQTGGVPPGIEVIDPNTGDVRILDLVWLVNFRRSFGSAE